MKFIFLAILFTASLSGFAQSPLPALGQMQTGNAQIAAGRAMAYGQGMVSGMNMVNVRNDVLSSPYSYSTGIYNSSYSSYGSAHTRRFSWAEGINRAHHSKIVSCARNKRINYTYMGITGPVSPQQECTRSIYAYHSDLKTEDNETGSCDSVECIQNVLVQVEKGLEAFNQGIMIQKKDLKHTWKLHTKMEKSDSNYLRLMITDHSKDEFSKYIKPLKNGKFELVGGYHTLSPNTKKKQHELQLDHDENIVCRKSLDKASILCLERNDRLHLMIYTRH